MGGLVLMLLQQKAGGGRLPPPPLHTLLLPPEHGGEADSADTLGPPDAKLKPEALPEITHSAKLLGA